MENAQHLILAALVALATSLPLDAAPPTVQRCGVVDSSRTVADFRKFEWRTRGTAAEVTWNDGLRVTFRKPDASLRLLAPKNGRDLNDAVILGVEIRNPGDRPLTLIGELNKNASSRGFLHLPPRGRGTMALHLMRREQDHPRPELFPGMRGTPGGIMQHWDQDNASHVLHSLSLSDLDGTAVGKTIVVSGLHAIGRHGTIPPPGIDAFFPFVDMFGQYKHATWPGKISAVADLKSARTTEAADLTTHPGPGSWSQYGGWKDGPKLKATGHFRTAKHGGKWWLVDPEGHLFWSHGVTGVGVGSRTALKGRTQFFEAVPAKHRDRNRVDFLHANLERKHGASWETTAAKLAHRRLRSWGMNSAGNWSDNSFCAMRKTPYFVPIHYGGKGGNPKRDPDALRKVLEQRMAAEPTRNDPWCVGYFVDNELNWNEVMEPELYYRTVSEVMKRLAPHKLYLGSRLHGHKHVHGGPEKAATAAAKYCDVVGINRYRFSPADLRMPEGADKPIIIGEFHFGALDRGMLHPGLRAVGDQQQRAHAYRHYLTQALAHPNIVGTHWFQYREQAVTGRSDGENYQIGFIDIADTPSHALVAAAREIGARLYQVRSQRQP